MKPDLIDQLADARRRYEKSEKGKTSKNKYDSSSKGKEAKTKYIRSEKGMAAQLRYYLSEKGTQARGKKKELRDLLTACALFLEANPDSTTLDFLASLKEG